MKTEEITVYAHIAADSYVKEGTAQLLVAAKDYQLVRDFFRKHFEVCEFVENGVGERYCMKLSRITHDDET